MEYHHFTKKEKKHLFKCLKPEESDKISEIMQFLTDDQIDVLCCELFFFVSIKITSDLDRVMKEKIMFRKNDCDIEELHQKTTEGITKGNINDNEADLIFEKMSSIKSLLDSQEDILDQEIDELQYRYKHLEKLRELIDYGSNGLSYS